MMKHTTHNFLHEQGMNIIGHDINEILKLLNRSDSNIINDEHIIKAQNAYKKLNQYRTLFINCANEPDRCENRSYFEYYKYIENYGIIVKRIRFLPLPFIFSQHFYSPESVTNYVAPNESKFVLKLCECKIKLLKELGYQLKKQGLTYNAMNLFLYHAEKSIIYLEENNFELNNSIIIELSRAVHYLEDLCETHHTTNKIGIGIFSFLLKLDPIKNIKFRRVSNHTEFEKYVYNECLKKNKDKYILNSVLEFSKINSLKPKEKSFWDNYAYYNNFFNYEYMSNRKDKDCFKQACHWISVFASTFSCGDCSFYDFNKPTSEYYDKVRWALSYSEDDWDKNAEQTLKMAQISVAVFLFSFLLYMSNPELFYFPLRHNKHLL